MSADAQGNDVEAVAVPIGGFVGVAPYGTPIPTPSQGASPTFVLPAAFFLLGLIKEDGGFQWSWAPDGDPLTFWQAGYQIPTGLAKVSLEFTAAEFNYNVRRVMYGQNPDANGFVEVDGGGTSTQWVLFTEEIFKNGGMRRRVAPNTLVGSVSEDKSTNGEVQGEDLTFTINRSPLLNNNHFGEWYIAPSDDPS